MDLSSVNWKAEITCLTLLFRGIYKNPDYGGYHQEATDEGQIYLAYLPESATQLVRQHGPWPDCRLIPSIEHQRRLWLRLLSEIVSRGRRDIGQPGSGGKEASIRGVP